MNYKGIVFFDIDGTLVNSAGKIEASVAEALRALKKNHFLPIVATGRAVYEVAPVMKKAGIDSIISMNGAYIEINGQEIYSDPFTQEEMLTLNTFCQRRGADLAGYSNFDAVTTGKNKILAQHYQYSHSPYPPVENNFFQRPDLYMMIVGTETADEDYQKKFTSLNFFRNTPYSMDIVRKGNTKGSGVSKIKKALGLEKLPTYAFGDGNNDVALFEAVDHKIAMKNGVEKLKSMADFITTSNDEDGIQQGLTHFHLI